MHTFRYLDIDEVDSRLALASISINKLGPTIQKVLPHDPEVHLDKHGCLPLFLLLKNKAVVSVIIGADSPNLISSIMEYIKPLASKEVEQ